MPARASLSATNALYGATKFSSIREPQVVRSPSVMITSLWARGMPVNGDAVPAAMRASAALACDIAPSRSTVRNAFSVRFAVSMRSRSEPVSSMLDKRRASKERESSATEEVITKDDQSTLTETSGQHLSREPGRGACLTPQSASFDHFRHQIQPVLNGGRAALIYDPLVRVALPFIDLAPRRHHILSVGHPHDARRIQRAHVPRQPADQPQLVSYIQD